MQALAIVLSNLVAAAAAAADKAKAPSPELDAILDQVSSLEPAKQQEWLRHLKVRLDRATALSLSPSTAAKKKAQYEAQLTQKAITPRDVARVAPLWPTRARRRPSTWWPGSTACRCTNPSGRNRKNTRCGRRPSTGRWRPGTPRRRRP